MYRRYSVPKRWNKLSIAIGNNKPRLLVSLEREIWNTLLKIAQDSTTGAIHIALHALVESHVFQEALALPVSDPIFSFFQHMFFVQFLYCL